MRWIIFAGDGAGTRCRVFIIVRVFVSGPTYVGGGIFGKAFLEGLQAVPHRAIGRASTAREGIRNDSGATGEHMLGPSGAPLQSRVTSGRVDALEVLVLLC